MDSITLFVLALGLSMDAFAVSISNSMCFSGLRRNEAALTSLSFGVFQGLMPVAGYFAGRAFADVVSAFDHLDRLCTAGLHRRQNDLGRRQGAARAEACPVGRAFSYKRWWCRPSPPASMRCCRRQLCRAGCEHRRAASFIACVTFVCCLAGHLLGKKFGSWLGGKAEIFGGVILVYIGAKILVEHLSGG